ncbi:hypothetical protein GCM10008171_11200 [Methylopila jiangsuensis]|uniref:Uncharacterized protein n=1 Tax=Methylopila jiangsuensis TaxID=586230 RepID=A0A9W6N344_9HYPH|nr:hypothetical protein GCM10008171_11200 [Methylopila jiangsuensis]
MPRRGAQHVLPQRGLRAAELAIGHAARGLLRKELVERFGVFLAMGFIIGPEKEKTSFAA